MMPQAALLIATILVVLVAGIALAHVVQWPRRGELSTLPIVRSQRVVSRYSAILGLIDAAARTWIGGRSQPMIRRRRRRP